MATPQRNQFANELGFIRREGVFSTIDVRRIDQTAGNLDAFNVQYASLKLDENITLPNQRGTTCTLAEKDSEALFSIPNGSCILEVAIVDRSGGKLDPELAFALGYLSHNISDIGRLTLLAQRIASKDSPVLGSFLNQKRILHIDQRLTSDSVAQMDEICDAEDKSNGVSVSSKHNNAILKGNNFAGERISLIPAITVLSGNLLSNQLEFVFKYIPGTQ